MTKDQYETFITMWHPEAEAELEKVTDRRERFAIHTALDKVRRNGPRVCAPHRKHVQGASGLHSLRPKGGRSVWRVLYACSGDRSYLLLAVTKTPKVSPRAFKSGVEKACRRGREHGLDFG